MNKKIKSVKLAKDYRTQFCEIKAGTVFIQNLSNSDVFIQKNYSKEIYNFANGSFLKKDILECKTGLFEIEYEEEEHFEYQEKLYSADKNFVDAVINADNLKNKNFLNALADWCDEKYINKGEDYYAVYRNSYNDINITYSNIDICYIGLKFDSFESAMLFLSELDRAENKAAKEYYIELLKSRRLE